VVLDLIGVVGFASSGEDMTAESSWGVGVPLVNIASSALCCSLLTDWRLSKLAGCGVVLAGTGVREVYGAFEGNRFV